MNNYAPEAGKTSVVLTNVKEVREVYSLKECNELLKEGWILLGIMQHSDGKQASGYYVLGRVE